MNQINIHRSNKKPNHYGVPGDMISVAQCDIGKDFVDTLVLSTPGNQP